MTTEYTREELHAERIMTLVIATTERVDEIELGSLNEAIDRLAETWDNLTDRKKREFIDDGGRMYIVETETELFDVLVHNDEYADLIEYYEDKFIDYIYGLGTYYSVRLLDAIRDENDRNIGDDDIDRFLDGFEGY